MKVLHDNMWQSSRLSVTLTLWTILMGVVLPHQVPESDILDESLSDITSLHRRISVRKPKISFAPHIDGALEESTRHRRQIGDQYSRSRRQGSQLLPSEEENGESVSVFVFQGEMFKIHSFSRDNL